MLSLSKNQRWHKINLIHPPNLNTIQIKSIDGEIYCQRIARSEQFFLISCLNKKALPSQSF